MSTTSFGRAGHPIRDGDGTEHPPEAFTAVARPSLCRAGCARGAYHWNSVLARRIAWPYSMAGLAELHEHTIARVLWGEVAPPHACARCAARSPRRAPAPP